jgi:hypothetical protein
MSSTAWLTAGIQIAICLIALARFGNPRWALGWLVGVIALLDGVGFLIRDPDLLTRPGADPANSGFMKEYMAAQLLIGVIMFYALATNSRVAKGGERRPALLKILPDNDAIVRTLGTLFFGILCFAVLFHWQSVLTNPSVGPDQQILYSITDAIVATLILISLLRFRRFTTEPVVESRGDESP